VAGLFLSNEATLGDGIYPAEDYIAQVGRGGIGSHSHLALSVFEELRWLEYRHRLRYQRRNRLNRIDQPKLGRTLYESAHERCAQAIC
ncbi:formimidoylglutamate deiminase, partial [Pseudomonas syringae pv. tagetis]